MPADPASPAPNPLPTLSDEALLARLPAAAALPDAPAAWLARAQAAWRTPAPGVVAQLGSQLGQLARQLHAVLSFDSWATAPLAAGLRAAGPAAAAPRQLVFSAEGRDVDLRIAPHGAQFAIHGQLLGPDDSATIALRPEPTGDSAAPLHACALDALGEFQLTGIAPGRYTLSLSLPGHTLQLPGFDVGPRPDGSGAAG